MGEVHRTGLPWGGGDSDDDNADGKKEMTGVGGVAGHDKGPS